MVYGKLYEFMKFISKSESKASISAFKPFVNNMKAVRIQLNYERMIYNILNVTVNAHYQIESPMFRRKHFHFVLLL